VTAYWLHTPASSGRPLEAWSLPELAELVECALLAGDLIDRLAASDAGRSGQRGLLPSELQLVLVLVLSR
jgi:hypothetical protein